MGRQSISFTEPNDDWLKSQVTSNEFESKSGLVNDLIRQVRGQQQKIDWLATKLDWTKKSGISTS
jgi:antitoxin ParD1/3/4